VFGRRAGEAAAAFSREADLLLRSRRVLAEAQDDLEQVVRRGDELARPLQRALRDVMWANCGVVRDAPGLDRGLSRIGELGRASSRVDVLPSEEGWAELGHALDLRAGLLTGEATIRCALARRESRGAHFRSDFPQLNRASEVNFYASLVDGALVTTSAPVPAAPSELERLVRDGETVDLGRRLLE
jgi:succinate dehydrogenase / fumarate reductase flavoprotein subunit